MVGLALRISDMVRIVDAIGWEGVSVLMLTGVLGVKSLSSGCNSKVGSLLFSLRV